MDALDLLATTAKLDCKYRPINAKTNRIGLSEALAVCAPYASTTYWCMNSSRDRVSV
jgi:hypothetical protein